jgi:hypothetical protein
MDRSPPRLTRIFQHDLTVAADEHADGVRFCRGCGRSRYTSGMSGSLPVTPDRHAEFVGLLTANHPRLLGYCMSLVGRRHDAEDVLQKASLTMWQKFAGFTLGTDFLAWATTICFYEAKNFQRLAARSPLVFDDRLLALLATERLTLDSPADDQAADACGGIDPSAA